MRLLRRLFRERKANILRVKRAECVGTKGLVPWSPPRGFFEFKKRRIIKKIFVIYCFFALLPYSVVFANSKFEFISPAISGKRETSNSNCVAFHATIPAIFFRWSLGRRNEFSWFFLYYDEGGRKQKSFVPPSHGFSIFRRRRKREKNLIPLC